MVYKRFSLKEIELITLISVVVLSGCATVKMPNIGQSGYSLAADEKRLYKRADEVVEQIDDSDLVYENQELENYLNQIANQLLPVEIKNNEVAVVVKVIKDPTLNAFALPNGRIYIHTGMLAVMDNEAQLAALLGHEMTHTLHRHALKQFRSLTNKSAFFATLQAPLVFAGGNLAGLLGQITFVSSVFGYSKDLELEADGGGFTMMRDNRYDVKESTKLFERLDQFIKDEDIKEPFFFSTHPNVVARIKSFEGLIRKSEVSDQAVSEIKEEPFRQLTRQLVLDNFQFCLQKGMFKTADRHISRFLEKYPDSPEGYWGRGELFRQRQDSPEKRKKKREKAQDYTEAIKAFDQAILLNPRLASAYQGRGLVLQKQGDIPGAKEAFQRYLELNPQASDKEYIENFLVGNY